MFIFFFSMKNYVKHLTNKSNSAYLVTHGVVSLSDWYSTADAVVAILQQ